jgi:putative membrane protein
MRIRSSHFPATFLLLTLCLIIVSCSSKVKYDTAADSAAVDTNPNAMMSKPTGALSDQDRQFVAKALIGNKGEVELGNMALGKTKTANVKEFAQMMVDDHSKAYDELMQLASSKSISTTDTMATAEQIAAKEKLSKLSGKSFDKEYMSIMVKDHEKARDDFQNQATGGSDAELKAYAAKYLDGITKHLQRAREMDTVAVSASK